MRPHGTTQETIYIFTAVEISKLVYIHIYLFIYREVECGVKPVLGAKLLFADQSPNEKWPFCLCLHYCACLCSDYI